MFQVTAKAAAGGRLAAVRALPLLLSGVVQTGGVVAAAEPQAPPASQRPSPNADAGSDGPAPVGLLFGGASPRPAEHPDLERMHAQLERIRARPEAPAAQPELEEAAAALSRARVRRGVGATPAALAAATGDVELARAALAVAGRRVAELIAAGERRAAQRALDRATSDLAGVRMRLEAAVERLSHVEAASARGELRPAPPGVSSAPSIVPSITPNGPPASDSPASDASEQGPDAPRPPSGRPPGPRSR